MQSFLAHGRETIRRYRASGSGIAVERSKARALRCLDLTQIAPAARDDQDTERAVLLLELLDRLELPPPEEIPDVEEVEDTGLIRWTIPNTEITISRTPEGPYAGEFQFHALTVRQLPTFSERDQMMMRTTLGLRYETTPDQLRYVLAKLRELFIAHPRVSPDPARARFIGFGDFSLNIEIYVYVRTNEYNEYLAIAEDLNFRIMDIVAESGTGFAFPSQTAYLARDTGMDAERTQAIEDEVQAWRGEDALPFPWPDADRVQALDGSLDYPPTGSTHYRQKAGDGQSAAADANSAPESKARRRWGIMRPSPAGKR